MAVRIKRHLFFIVLLAFCTIFSAESARAGSQRIVSLAPSNTELIYSLGAEDELVGRSKFCDYPPQVKTKAIVGDFVAPNIERLTQVKPDVVLLVNGQETVDGLLKKHHFKTRLLKNLHLEEIPQNLLTLGSMTGSQPRAQQLSAGFETALQKLRRILRGQRRPRVLFVAWPKPLMTVGAQSFVNDCITTAGGINVAADLPASYPHISQERLLLSTPDVIIFPFEAQTQTFWKEAPWTSLKAMREKRFYFLPKPDADGLSRPTLRVIDGLYWLTSRIHPQCRPAVEAWYQQSHSFMKTTGKSARSIGKASH